MQLLHYMNTKSNPDPNSNPNPNINSLFGLMYTPLHGMQTELKINFYNLNNAHQCLHAV